MISVGTEGKPRFGTGFELRPVFDKALELVDIRDKKYSDRWKKEPIDNLFVDIWRKADGVKYQVSEGLKDNIDPEDLLDIVNYAAMAYWRITNDKK